MDPEAELVVEGRVVLQGGLVAPRTPVFREMGSGMVIIGSDLDSICPEWWGAVAGGDDDHEDRNSDAIQRAIDAASARRCPIIETLDSENRVATTQSDARRPVTVLFSGRYVIRRPLWMGRQIVDTRSPTPQVAGVGRPTVRTFGSPGAIATTLRGLATGRANPACGIQAQPDAFSAEAPTPSALLILQHAYGAVVENLLLDGSRTANYSLIAQTTRERPTMRSVAIRRCHVRGARRGQIQVGQPVDERARGETITLPAPSKPGSMMATGTIAIPAETGPFSTGDLTGLSIEENLIECVPPRSHERGADTDLSVGIQLRAANGVAIRVARNVFRGYAKTFVDARATMVLIEGCDFGNMYAPSRDFSARGALGFEEADGEDVYLTSDRWQSGPSGRKLSAYRNPVEGAVAIAHCVSYSAQLFGTPRPGPLQNKRSERADLILHVCHIPQPWTPKSSHVPETSVYWGRYSPSAPRIVQVGSKARGLNPDPALSVVGSLLGRGMTIGVGAAQSVVVSCSMPNRLQQPRFIETRRGFIRPTVVFGIRTALAALVLLLLSISGCASGDSSRPSALDAQVNDLSEVRDRDEASFDAASLPDVSASVDAPRDALTDAPVDRWWFSRDIAIPAIQDARNYDQSMTPRQAYRSCPTSTTGDPAIAPPRLIFPLSTMRVTSRRPTLIWELAPGTAGAHIEICRDPCCATPIASFDVEGTQGRPPEALPSGVVFWRARGRVGQAHGQALSFTWEFSVRRRDLPSDTAAGTLRDYNGDGYDDVATIAWNTMIVYWGGIDGLSPDRRQDVPLPGYESVIAAGDVNGDGYGDVVGSSNAMSPGSPYTNLGQTWVAYGSRDGLRIRDVPIVTGKSSRIGVVDLNGDGFSDCVTVAPTVSSDELFGLDALFGSERGFDGARQRIRSPDPPRLHGYLPPIAASGDLDGDGYGDLLATNPDGGDGVGAVYVYRGHAGSVSPLPDRVIAPEREGLFGMPGFGTSLRGLGDLNGDRREDVLIWESRRDATNVYLGHRDDLLRHAQRLLWDGPFTKQNRLGFGNSGPLAPDLDLDGTPELVLGCQACVDETDRQFELGRVFIYRGVPGTYGVPSLVLRPLPGVYRGHFPVAITVIDLNGDGADDLVLGDPGNDLPPYRGRIDYYLGGENITRRTIYGEQSTGVLGAIGYYFATAASTLTMRMTNG